uniref:TAF1C beta-propeller domain-containing protein n=1 Tax=Ornithodoros erraticus TaxID=265619 RepID=A0A293N4M7_ORNER
MSNLPVILPTWNNLAEHRLVGLQQEVLDPKFNPDFGGAGVDVCDSGHIEIKELKCNDVHENRFRANTVALPFIPPNQVSYSHDPCLQTQLEQNRQIEAFEASLHVYRGKLKLQTDFAKAVNQLVKEASEERPFSSPVPKQLASLIRCKPKSLVHREYNLQYSGGCLSTLPTSDNCSLLFYTSGAHLDTLAVSLVVPKDEGQLLKVDKTVTCRSVHGSGHIYHLAAQRVDEDVYCTTRLEKQCLCTRISDTLESIEVIGELETDETLCFAIPSTYIPGELLYITSAGALVLYSCDSQRPTWQTTVSHADPASWWQCCFGSHPRCVCYMDSVTLYQRDARDPNAARKAVCGIGDECFLDDQLTVLKTNDALPHQYYIGSLSHLVLWDERYWKYPMMQWNHGLKHSPTFISETRLCGRTYITLGSQRSREVALFCADNSSLPQPSSPFPPWHMSRTSDFTKVLERQGIEVPPDVDKRASAPLVGGCLVASPRGLTGLQLTSFCDIFYQDFELSSGGSLADGNWKFGFGGEPVDVLHEVQWWMDCADLPQEEVRTDRLRWVNVQHVKEAFVAADLPPDDYGVPQLDAMRRAANEGRCISYKEWNRGLDSDTPLTNDDLLPDLDEVDINATWDSRTTKLLQGWKDAESQLQEQQPSRNVEEDDDDLAALRHTLEDLDVSVLPPATQLQQSISQEDAQKKKKRRTQEGF